MGVLDKLLRAGEGRKVKALAGLVPDINALEPEIEKLSDDALQAKTGEFRQRLDNGEDLDDLLIEAFAVVREARPAHHRPAPLRRAADGRRGPALRLGRRDEDRRGQDPRVDPARVPQRADRQGRPPHHRQRLPGHAATPSGWARSTAGSGSRSAWSSPATTTPTTSAPQYALRHHLRHQQRVRLRLPARQHGACRRTTRCSGATPTHRRRGRLDPHRRGPHAAHHLAAGSADAAKLYYKFASIVRGLKRDVDYDVDEEKRIVAPTEEGVEKVEEALGVENLYDERAAEPRPPAPGRAAGQGALQAGQGLHRPARRGEDRRRVHRPHPRGPALVRGPAPGGRGQGGREDQGGEPDPRHDHPPELLPPVRQARRHDRHGR